LYENTYFHILNITHACRKNNQITATFMENQGNTLIITKKMKIDKHALMLLKNRNSFRHE